MRIEDVVRNAQGGAALANLAKAFGAAPADVETAFGSIMGELTQRMERNTLSRGGLADLVAALGNPANAAVLTDPSLAADPRARMTGNEALDMIFGSKDKSRRVAARAARASGLNAGLVERMLPVIAAMLMGGLGEETRSAFGSLPGFGGGGTAAGSPLPMPGNGGSFGGSTSTSAPNGVGDRFSGQKPLPIPGDDIPGLDRRPNSYDDLSDVIRRGGRAPGGSGAPGQGGGSLASLVRAILGAILGFQSRGIIGWLIRLIVIRWGWNLIRRILTRILFGRRA